MGKPRPRPVGRSAAHRAPLEAHLRGVFNSETRLRARITHVHGGGFSTILDGRCAARLDPGEMYRADISVPESHQPLQFIVRPTGGPPSAANRDEVTVDWLLCPADQPEIYPRSLAQLSCDAVARQSANVPHLAAGRNSSRST